MIAHAPQFTTAPARVRMGSATGRAHMCPKFAALRPAAAAFPQTASVTGSPSPVAQLSAGPRVPRLLLAVTARPNARSET